MKRRNIPIYLARKSVKTILQIASGYPVKTVPLVGGTLDWDDVEIARTWSHYQQDWENPSVVSHYEAEFARWNGSKYAFAFMGGRIALSACIHALGLQPGDEVILPGYTCVVVPNAFHYAKVKIVYSDIELDTYGLDASLLKSKITSKTRAILLHHLYGLVCRDYEAILDLASHYNIKVIEDCAHATGAEYKGKKVGNFGDVAFYSSEHSKVFTTVQGGIAITNNETIAKGIREYYQQAPLPDAQWIDKQLFNVILDYYKFKHPQRWWLGELFYVYHHQKHLISTTKEEEQCLRPVYYGRKMPAPIAFLGLNQLKKLDFYNEQRRQTSRQWDQWCTVNGYKKPVVIKDSVPVYLRYPILVAPARKQNPSWIRKELGVEPGVWFVSNIHPVPETVEGCPNADKAVQQCVNFPGLFQNTR